MLDSYNGSIGFVTGSGSVLRGTFDNAGSFGIGNNSSPALDPFSVTSAGAAAAASLAVGGGTAMTGNRGTGLLLQHSTGTATSGHCVQFDANGNTVDSGIATTVVPRVGTPIAGHAACIKSTGPVVIGYCSTVVDVESGTVLATKGEHMKRSSGTSNSSAAATAAWGQYTPPAGAAYIYSGGVWTGAPSTGTLGALSYTPPAIALYCLNGSGKWVPADSLCFAGCQQDQRVQQARLKTIQGTTGQLGQQLPQRVLSRT